MKTDLAILIFSCDSYSDCWEPMLHSFELFWPDCPYQKYIISNHKSISKSNTYFLKVGDHKGFGSDMIKALSMIDNGYILYFQEDYFIRKAVNTETIDNHYKHCIKENIELLKLSSDGNFQDHNRIGQTIYCKNLINKKYRINTDIAIWKKDSFLKVLNPNQNIWEWERSVSYYVQKNYPNFKSELLLSSEYLKSGINPIRGGAIMRGKWTPTAIEYLNNNGFQNLVYCRKHVSSVRMFLYCYESNNRIIRLLQLILLKFMNLI